MQRLGNTNTATLCCPAKPPLWIYMHDVGFLKWIYLKLRRLLKGWAVIFSSPPRSGAGFIEGAMNPAGCVRGTFWWWIQVAVPEIALWFGARLMGLFSWCCRERAAVRPVWGCIGGFPPLQICRLPSCVSSRLRSCWECSYNTKTPFPNCTSPELWLCFHSSVSWSV